MGAFKTRNKKKLYLYKSMTQSNESKVKRFTTRLFKGIERGKPFKISFQGDTAQISQDQIDSVKEKHGSSSKMGILGQVALNDPAQNPHLGNECTQ